MLPKKSFPGFYKGGVYFSVGMGSLLSRDGSLIQTEESYNKTLLIQSQLGAVDTRLWNLNQQTPGLIAPFRSKSGNVNNVSFEYGLNDYFGAGFSIMNFAIEGEGQFRYANYTSYPTFQKNPKPVSVFPLKQTYSIYNGTNATISLSFHFLPKFVIDPYIIIRAGGGQFNTSAQRTINDEIDYITNYNDRVGTSKIIGGAIGLNFYLFEDFGVKLELDQYKQFLKSDAFNAKTLVTSQIQFGFIFNLSEAK